MFGGSRPKVNGPYELTFWAMESIVEDDRLSQPRCPSESLNQTSVGLSIVWISRGNVREAIRLIHSIQGVTWIRPDVVK